MNNGRGSNLAAVGATGNGHQVERRLSSGVDVLHGAWMRLRTMLMATLALHALAARASDAQSLESTGTATNAEPATRARSTALRLAVGVSAPVGEFNDGFSPGSHLSAQVMFTPHQVKRIAFRGDLAFDRFEGRGNIIGRSAVGVSGNLLWGIARANDESLRRLYLLGGAGYARFPATSTIPSAVGGLTASAGVGTEFRLFSRTMFTELRVLQLNAFGAKQWIPLTLGTEL